MYVFDTCFVCFCLTSANWLIVKWGKVNILFVTAIFFLFFWLIKGKLQISYPRSIDTGEWNNKFFDLTDDVDISLFRSVMKASGTEFSEVFFAKSPFNLSTFWKLWQTTTGPGYQKIQGTYVVENHTPGVELWIRNSATLSRLVALFFGGEGLERKEGERGEVGTGSFPETAAGVIEPSQ